MEEKTLAEGCVLKERYRISHVIGKGSYGIVYCAADIQTDNTPRAVKEIWKGALTDGERTEATDLFNKEAALLQSLLHPGIPGTIDHFSEGSRHYLVMEFIEGETLDRISGKSEAGTVSSWALDVCKILEYLHGRKPEPVIFRDLKPSNIMKTPSGKIYLIDFGIARFFNATKVRDTYALGTPGYSPPEQYGSGQSDRRSDIYSLGATMYNLLSGEDMAAFKFKVPPLSQLCPEVSPLLEKIVMKCLEINPGERFQDAGEMKEALESYGAISSLSPITSVSTLHTSSAPGPARAWLRKYSAFLFILLFIIVVGVIWISFSLHKTHVQSISNEDNGFSNVFDAVRADNVQAVKDFLRKDPSLIHAVGQDTYTLLHEASAKGNKEMVELILSKGADPNAGGKLDGYTPLHKASGQGHKETVELLISKGANINAKADNGSTPLIEACRHSRNDVIKFLVQKGADINSIDFRGNSALRAASELRNKEIVDFLINKGADIRDDYCNVRSKQQAAISIREADHRNSKRDDVNAGNNEEDTLLLVAAEKGNKDEIESLLARGARVNVKDSMGSTLLHKAKKKEVAEILISHGADPNTKNSVGRTPLHDASQCKPIELVELLVKKGSDVNAKDKDGRTPLFCACLNGRVDVVEFLVSNGARIKEKSNWGWTPLFEVSRGKHVKMAEYLISRGDDVNERDVNGYTPLYSARTREMAELLISKGADVRSKTDHGWTPLHDACAYGKVEIAGLLIIKGAEVNAKTDKGYTPLCGVEKKEVAELLIAKGADINIKTKDGSTPLSLASKRGYHAVVDLLISYGAKR